MKLRSITAITPFKVIQGDRFLYQSKAHVQLPISEIVTYILPGTVSMTSLIIGQIFGVNRECLSLTQSLGEGARNVDSRIETSFCGVYKLQNIVRYLEPIDVTRKCDGEADRRTDGQTFS